MVDRVILNDFGFTITESRIITKDSVLPIKEITSVSKTETHLGTFFLGLGIFYLFFFLLFSRVFSFIVIMKMLISVALIAFGIHLKTKELPFGIYVLDIKMTTGLTAGNTIFKFYKRKNFLRFQSALEEAMISNC